ncbi:MAG: 30S ribosomal protein S6 [Alphaproteobacteria bacterium]|nr:30S ribosomal protein S6 [Alphaproteobacteria bacterium]
MAIYETVFLARSELSAKQVEELTEQFSKILETGPEGHDAKGKILKTEPWGIRTLVYKINKSKKAHYVLIESETTGTAMIETERVMRLHEDVMRYMTIKLDVATTEPSAILKKEEDKFEKKPYDKKPYEKKTYTKKEVA